MNTISVDLSDERLARLGELAQQAGVTPSELVQRSVDEWLARSDREFSDAAEYVISKNAELYRRLAQ